MPRRNLPRPEPLPRGFPLPPRAAGKTNKPAISRKKPIGSDVVLWRAENVANYLLKGKQVYVEGRLQTRSYDDKDGKKVYRTEVVADEVILLGGRGEGESSSMGSGGGGCRADGAASPAGGSPADDEIGPMGISDDDVPF